MPAAITHEEMSYLLVKIFFIFSEQGFDNISMDEVAKRINLSKATLYKYFKSKEDIVRRMVDDHFDHLREVKFDSGGIDAVLESVSWAYVKVVLTTATTSLTFLEDLENKFPSIYEDFRSALDAFTGRFLAFYEQVREQGYFRAVNARLFVDQAQYALRAVLTPTYIIQNHTTLPALLCDYYQLLLYQLLSEPYLPEVGKERTYQFMDHLLELLAGRF